MEQDLKDRGMTDFDIKFEGMDEQGVIKIR